MLAEIDFLRIRPLGNSRNKGFEELCVQLFRDTPHKAKSFYRVDDVKSRLLKVKDATRFISDLENGKTSCQLEKTLSVIKALGLNISIQSNSQV